MTVFGMMSGTVRGTTFGAIGTILHWIALNEPASYLVVAIAVGGPLLSYFLIVSWPRRPEAENPMIQYTREHPEMPE